MPGAAADESLSGCRAQKDIRYSSRTRMGTTSFCAEHDIRHNLQSLLDKLPDSLKDEPEVRFLPGYRARPRWISSS